MNKLTVIIPSLSVPVVSITNYTLQQLELSKSVEKIIIIDNTKDKVFKNKYTINDKCLIVEDQPNLYVNYAWNYGMSLVSSQYWLLLNDDVMVRANTIDAIIDKMEKNNEIGLTTIKTKITYNPLEALQGLAIGNGASPPSVQYEFRKYPNQIKQGWFMLGRTKDWQPITAKDKVFGGDDEIFIINQKVNHYSGACLVTNHFIYHAESTTVKISPNK